VEWSNVYDATSLLSLDADVAYPRARFRDPDPGGDRIPGAIEEVVSAGATVQDRGRWSGSLRLRYYGPRPRIEDKRALEGVEHNARLECRLGRAIRSPSPCSTHEGNGRRSTTTTRDG
jgi:hypothetical protein